MTVATKPNGKTKPRSLALMRSTLNRLSKEHDAIMARGDKLGTELRAFNAEFTALVEAKAIAKATKGGKPTAAKAPAPSG